MNQDAAASSIYFIRHPARHPLDEANRRLRDILYLAARDIAAMCNEKAAEGAGEQH